MRNKPDENINGSFGSFTGLRNAHNRIIFKQDCTVRTRSHCKNCSKGHLVCINLSGSVFGLNIPVVKKPFILCLKKQASVYKLHIKIRSDDF